MQKIPKRIDVITRVTTAASGGAGVTEDRAAGAPRIV